MEIYPYFHPTYELQLMFVSEKTTVSKLGRQNQNLRLGVFVRIGYFDYIVIFEYRVSNP